MHPCDLLLRKLPYYSMITLHLLQQKYSLILKAVPFIHCLHAHLSPDSEFTGSSMLTDIDVE